MTGRRNLEDLLGSTTPIVAEAPAAAPAAAQRRRTRTGTGKAPGAGLSAPLAVLAAYDSAQQTPSEWTSYGVRFPLPLADRLKVQRAGDRERTGLRQLHGSHYVQAALAGLPLGDPAKAAVIGQEWRAAQPRGAARQVTSPGTRLHQETEQAMIRLAGWLPTVPGRRVTIQDVAAAALTLLLDELGDSAITLQ